MTPTLFPDIAGAQEMAEANLRVGSVTARLWEVRVTPNFFEAMGVPVAKGPTLILPEPDMKLVGEASNGRITLMDLQMPSN
jgi:hypothetical protein